MAWASGLQQAAQDPLVGVQTLVPLLQLVSQIRQQRALRNDPRLLALLNNEVKGYNARTATSASGQRQAGNPYGDSASGYGGAFGHDRNGNPLSGFQQGIAYNTGQLQGSQAGFAAQQNQLNQLLAHSGAAGKMGPFRSNLGPMPNYDMGAVQGTDQGMRPDPQTIDLVERQKGVFGLPSFDVGTTSVPQTGLAVVHQGEMIVPAKQNPLAGAPSVPLATRQTFGGPQGEAATGGLTPPANAGQQAMPAPSGGVTLGGSYQAMTPGLDNRTQSAIINRGQEAIDAAAQAQMRGIRNNAGSVFSGGTRQDLFDAGVARMNQSGNLARDVGIQAAQQRFGDTLAMNQFELAKAQAGAQTALESGRLGLDTQLGQGRLALDTQLGQGQLANQRMGLQNEYALGLLNDSTNRLGMGQQFQLGQGRLGLDRQLGLLSAQTTQRGQDIQRQLGLGQQSLDRDLGFAQNQTTRDLGFGNQSLQRYLGDIQNQTTRDLGLGDLAYRNRGLDASINQFNDNFGRQLLQDNQENQRWWTSRNDNLTSGITNAGLTADQIQQLMNGDLGGWLAQYATA